MSTGSVIRGNSSRKPFVGANERRDRDCRLHFVRGERVVVQRLDGLRIAREILVLERERRKPGREVAQPFDGREDETGRRHLEREAFADESGELRLVLECVDRGDDAAGAVAKQKDRQTRVP